MAIITQGDISQNIAYNRQNIGNTDVFYRNVLRPVRVTVKLSFLSSASATVYIYGGNSSTESAITEELALITLSNTDPEAKFTIYNPYSYIMGNISNLSGSGAAVTISVNALEE